MDLRNFNKNYQEVAENTYFPGRKALKQTMAMKLFLLLRCKQNYQSIQKSDTAEKSFNCVRLWKTFTFSVILWILANRVTGLQGTAVLLWQYLKYKNKSRLHIESRSRQQLPKPLI